MIISKQFTELRKRSPLLFGYGIFLIATAIALLLPLSIDDRTILGINPWIKPIKFCISTAIYIWAFAWISFDLPHRFNKWSKRLNTIVGISLIIEIPIILIQSARGVRSHFNFETNFDALLFGIMGLFILINTICLLILLILFLFKNDRINTIYLIGIRLGLIIIMIGNWVGQVMINQGQHAVGVRDGGEGIPFLNWSTEGGDLRIAHFLGLHALQIMPLSAHYINQLDINHNTKKLCIYGIAMIYTAFIILLYRQALSGSPLF